jgi:hypothetical protein
MDGQLLDTSEFNHHKIDLLKRLEKYVVRQQHGSYVLTVDTADAVELEIRGVSNVPEMEMFVRNFFKVGSAGDINYYLSYGTYAMNLQMWINGGRIENFGA